MFEPSTTGVGNLRPRDLCLNKLGKGPLCMQCYKPNLKHLSKMVGSDKKVYNFFLLSISMTRI